MKRGIILLNRHTLRSTLCPLLAAFIWGAAFVAQGVCADNGMEPFTVNAVRAWIGAFTLLLFSLLMRKKLAPPPEQRSRYRRQLLWGGLGCGLALTAAVNLQQAGIAETDPGKAGFITSLYVVLVPVFGLLLRRRVPYTVWIGTGVALLGLYLLCITDTFSLTFGDSLLLLCAVFFAVQILLVDHLPNIHGIHLCCAQLFTVAATSTVLMFVFETPTLSTILSSWLPLAYIGVLSSAVAYTLQIVAQKNANPTVVTLLLSLESVFAVLTGWLLLGDTLSVREIIGCVLMFGAVTLANIPAKGQSPSPEA